MRNKLSLALLMTLLAQASWGGTPGKIGDLAWMSGHWAGPVGPGTVLEENWIQPTGGSIASLVRITTADKTPMVELIVIEQQGDSLMLYVKQWDPAFSPRTEGPQVMELVEMGERSVKFRNTGEGAFKTLAYSSPTADVFYIDILPAEGEAFRIPLQAQ